MTTKVWTASTIFISALVAMPIEAHAVLATPAADLAAGPSGAILVPAAFGDLPASGTRRRGRKAHDSKPSAPAEARKDVQGETAEQHKAYLKRYGF